MRIVPVLLGKARSTAARRRPMSSAERTALESSLAVLHPSAGDRPDFVTRVGSRLAPVIGGNESGPMLDLGSAIQTVTWMDDGSIRCEVRPLRSYVDVEIPVRLLMAVAHLAAARGSTPAAVLERSGASDSHDRIALLALGRCLLEEGDGERALVLAKRALATQAVCLTADDLWRDASIATGRAVHDPSDRFCPVPFTHLTTGYQGEAYLCACPAWIPFSAGNLLDAADPDAVWRSESAELLRASILDGSYRYCSRTLCSHLSAANLPRRDEVTDPELRRVIDDPAHPTPKAPRMVELAHDPTCNLACPSCRTEVMVARTEEVDRYQASVERSILPLLRDVQGIVYLSGGGEALASKHFRSILGAINCRDFPGLKVQLITNGQLLTPSRWAALPDLPTSLDKVMVSLDAATADTYERLRPPGRWAPLLENLEHLAELRRSETVPQVMFNFVVQVANFRELPAFVELADHLAADMIWLQRVTNYGTYDAEEFPSLDVCDPAHPDHDELVKIIDGLQIDPARVEMGMLLSGLPEGLAARFASGLGIT